MLSVQNFSEREGKGILILNVDGDNHKIDFLPDDTGEKDFIINCPSLVDENQFLIQDDDEDEFVSIIGQCCKLLQMPTEYMIQ